MNKLDLFKKIAFICAAALIVIAGIVVFFQTLDVYSDEYGTDISINNDAICIFIVGASFLTYGIYALVKGEDKFSFTVAGLVATATACGFSFGKYFKALAKAISKGKEFDALANQPYLFYGIIALALAVYFAISLYSVKTEK